MPPNLNEEKKLWGKGFKRVACLDEVGRGCLAGPVMAAAVMTNSKLKNRASITELLKEARWKKRAKPSSPYGSESKNIRSSLPFAATRVGKEGNGVLFASQNSNLQLKTKNLLKEIKDSKKLSPKKREEFYEILINHPQIKWGIGRVSEKVIDKINILEATKLAMEKAIEKLKMKNVKPSTRAKLGAGLVPYRNKVSGTGLKIDYLILDGKMKLNLPIPQKSIVKADEKVFSCAAASIIAKVMRDRLMRSFAKKYPHYGFDKHKGYATKLHLAKLKKHGSCEIHRKSFRPVKTCKLK